MASQAPEATGLAAVPAPLSHVALTALAVLPLFVAVPANVNVILTACLTVFTGCWRSVKPTPPAEAMSKKVIPASAIERGRLEFRIANCC
jgi:hypothetical protein